MKVLYPTDVGLLEKVHGVDRANSLYATLSQQTRGYLQFRMYLIDGHEEFELPMADEIMCSSEAYRASYLRNELGHRVCSNYLVRDIGQ